MRNRFFTAQIALVILSVVAITHDSTAQDEQLFTVTNKTFFMDLIQGYSTDYIHGDLVVFKQPAAGLTQAPSSITFLASNVWVGGVWANYGDWTTKTSYITQSSDGQMNCGPDVDLPYSGSGTESVSGTGGAGLWFMGFDWYYSLSNGGYGYGYCSPTTIQALQTITINSDGSTQVCKPGDTYVEGNGPMLITLAKPPTAVATTNATAIAAGGSVILDGTGSHVNSQSATKISQWDWQIDNLTNSANSHVTTFSPMLTQTLTDPGDYSITLTVTDDLGLVSDSTYPPLNVAAVAVTFNPTSVTVVQGSTATTSATIVPTDAVNSVAFSTDDMTIATVTPTTVSSSPGLLTVSGVASGTATLQAQISGSGVTCGTADITVAVAVQPLNLSGPDTIFVGNSGVIKATDGTAPYTFSVAPAGLLTVTDQGNGVANASAVKPGKVTVTATDANGLTASKDITVVKVTFDPNPINLAMLTQENQTLVTTLTTKVTVEPADTDVSLQVNGAGVFSAQPQSGRNTFSVTVQAIGTGSGNITPFISTDTGTPVPVNVKAVSVVVRGRQIIGITNPDPTEAHLGGMAVEITPPDQGVNFQQNAVWTTTGAATIGVTGYGSGPAGNIDQAADIGQAVNNLGGAGGIIVIGATVHDQTPEYFKTKVAFNMDAGGGNIFSGEIAANFAAISITVAPAGVPNPGLTFQPGDPPVLLTATIAPSTTPSDYPMISAGKIFWDKVPVTADSFSYDPVNTVGQLKVKVVPVKPSPDLNNPQSAIPAFSLQGTTLDGNPLLITIRGQSKIKVGGAEATTDSGGDTKTIRVTESTDFSVNVRPLGGTAAFDSAPLLKTVNFPNVAQSPLHVVTNNILLDMAGIDTTASPAKATIKGTYTHPSAPSAPASITLHLNITPANAATITGGKDTAYLHENTVQFQSDLMCDTLTITGATKPVPTWKFTFADNGQIETNQTGTLTIGSHTGTVKVQVDYSRAANPKYVIDPVTKVRDKDVTILSPTLKIINPPGNIASITSRNQQFVLQAKVFYPDNTQPPNAAIEWIINGQKSPPVLGHPGRYHVVARTTIKGKVFSDTRDIMLSVVHEWEASKSETGIDISPVPGITFGITGGIVWFREVGDVNDGDTAFFFGVRTNLPVDLSGPPLAIAKDILKKLATNNSDISKFLANIGSKFATFTHAIQDLGPTAYQRVKGADKVASSSEFFGDWVIKLGGTSEDWTNVQHGYQMTQPRNITFGERDGAEAIVTLQSRAGAVHQFTDLGRQIIAYARSLIGF